MGANKSILLLLFSLIATFGFSQSNKKTFSFQEQPLPEVVQSIVESFGLYVSYDPKIFKDHPKISFNIKVSSLEGALEQVLGERFSFQVINEYVVINLRKVSADVHEQPPASDPQVVYDTIVVHQTEVHYDTLIVEKVEMKQVYDTTIT